MNGSLIVTLLILNTILLLGILVLVNYVFEYMKIIADITQRNVRHRVRRDIWEATEKIQDMLRNKSAH